MTRSPSRAAAPFVSAALAAALALSAPASIFAAESSGNTAEALNVLGALVSSRLSQQQSSSSGSGVRTSPSEAASSLADCLYRNTGSTDRDTFVQWAFVTIGKSSAAQSIAKISAAKTKEVEGKAQSALTKLVLKSCPKEVASLVISDPKNGLENTLAALANKLVSAEIEKRTSPLLNLTITDLLKK